MRHLDPTVSGLFLCGLIKLTHDSLCFIPLRTWKHFIQHSTSNFNYHCTNYIKSLTSPSDTAGTSKTNCLWALRFEQKALNRNTNRMFCGSLSLCFSYYVSSKHFWLFIYCFLPSLSICLQYDSENMFMSMPEPSQDFVPGNQVG